MDFSLLQELMDSNDFSISIPWRRINDLLESLNEALLDFEHSSARKLVQTVGKIISREYFKAHD